MCNWKNNKSSIRRALKKSQWEMFEFYGNKSKTVEICSCWGKNEKLHDYVLARDWHQ